MSNIKLIIVYMNVYHIASSELLHLGSLYDLTKDLNYIDQQIIYDKVSAIKYSNGIEQVQFKDQSSLPLIQRLQLKLALEFFILHYDHHNSAKNIFITKINDINTKQSYAIPGMYDLGNCFNMDQLDEYEEMYHDDVYLQQYAEKIISNTIDSFNADLTIHQNKLGQISSYDNNKQQQQVENKLRNICLRNF